MVGDSSTERARRDCRVTSGTLVASEALVTGDALVRNKALVTSKATTVPYLHRR
jgi:hypothetical protein